VDKEINKGQLQKLTNIEEELLVIYNDFLISGFDRICQECGCDHSYKPKFKGVKTSIEIISELWGKYNSKQKIQEVSK